MTMFNMEHAEQIVEEHLLGDALRIGVADGYAHRTSSGAITIGGAVEITPLSGEWAGDRTAQALTRELLAEVGVDADEAPAEWLNEVEADLAAQYEAGYYEGVAGHAKPCVKTVMNAICEDPGTYCECEITRR